MEAAAQRLAAFCDALPELPDDIQGALATRLPGVLSAPPAEARARLERIGELAGIGLEAAARLVAKVRRSRARVRARGPPHVASSRGVPAAGVSPGRHWHLNTP